MCPMPEATSTMQWMRKSDGKRRIRIGHHFDDQHAAGMEIHISESGPLFCSMGIAVLLI
jgi:hypothetical protein